MQDNEVFTSINQAPLGPNNLAQLANNFVLSNKNSNLLDRFDTDRVNEFNLNSQKPSPWQSPLVSHYNMQPTTVSKWDIFKVKKFDTRTPGFDMLSWNIINTFDFQP